MDGHSIVKMGVTITMIIDSLMIAFMILIIFKMVILGIYKYWQFK